MILSLDKDRQATIERLGSLGLVHIEQIEMKDSEDRSAVQYRINRLAGVVNEIKSLKVTPGRLHPDEADADGEALFEQATRICDSIAELEKKVERLERDISVLSPWGDFDFSIVEDLRRRGLHIHFCSAPREIFESIRAKYSCQIVRDEKQRILFLAISEEEIDPVSIPSVSLPSGTGLGKARRELEAARNSISEQKKALSAFKSAIGKLNEYRKTLEAENEYLGVRDSMGSMDRIIILKGYIEAGKLESLSRASRENGWGIVATDPLPDDRVPTLIRLPAIFRIARPIFEFIGVEPGYDELDVSVCFLFFFTIFFAMLVGDAGYGALFLVAAIFCKFKFKGVERIRLPLNLFLFLSFATIVWGVLTGTYFGLPTDKFPACMRGIDYFTDQSMKDKNIQLLCFLLAGCHLSFARLWRAFIIMGWKSLGQIGWALMIWANFFTITGLLINEGKIHHFTVYLYIASAVLLLVFFIDWRSIGDIFNFPFTVIGSFTDVLSYIRLYAVGLSSYYVTTNVNAISGTCIDSGSILLVLLGILIIFLGHTMNIILSFLAVLVHGIRLNTLEFSNHMELQWKGFPFHPFRIDESSLKANVSK